MNNAIGYRRLSEKDQSNYSLDYQDKAISDYCTRNKLNLIGIYTDNGKSSYTFDRPDYKALESYLKANKGKVDYLIIMDHDRFSRNLPEALMKIDELQNKFKIKVLSTSEAVNIDTQDPAVFIKRAFDYLIANQELFRIRKRTRDGIREAQLSGRHVNHASYGYINSKDSEDKGIIVIDEQKTGVVQKIFKAFLDGMPVNEIHKMARKEGFNRNGNSAIPRILSNQLYIGKVKVTGTKDESEKWVKGIHQPIISEADFWLVQEKLGNKRKSKCRPKDEFPLRGILKCWCGKSMTAGFSKGKNKYYLYYRCLKHTETNYPGEKLHKDFEDLLELLSFTKPQVQKISEDANAFMNKSASENKKITAARESQIQEIDRKMERLEDRLVDEEIDGATFKRLKIKLNTERNLLVNSQHEMNAINFDVKWKQLESFLPKLTSLKTIYDISSSISRKQTLIRGVFKHQLTYKDGSFRTPRLDGAFAHNSLNAKEKGLLLVEQPSSSRDQVPFGSP